MNRIFFPSFQYHEKPASIPPQSASWQFVLTAVLLLSIFTGSSIRAEGIPAVDALVQQGIEAQQMPGAVVMLGVGDQVVHLKAYGHRQVEPSLEPMTLDTVFDLASLTKPIATATSVLLLAEQGKIDISAPVSQYLPEFSGDGREMITIEQLLIHTSGLIADNNLSEYRDGADGAWKNICRSKLHAAPGERFVYSDVGYITLGTLVERISGQPLREFTAEHLFTPLKMLETGYLPAEALKERAAPTEKQGDHWLKGEVHDPRCAAMGGVAGHAGLFSTAADLSRYARMVLKRGELDGVRVMHPETVAAMLVSRPIPGGGLRTWGWDRKSSYSINRGEGMSDLSIGHGGFTGTGLWIDPEQNLYVIFLSNRVHPSGKGAVNKLIGSIGTAFVEHVKQGNLSTTETVHD